MMSSYTHESMKWLMKLACDLSHENTPGEVLNRSNCVPVNVDNDVEHLYYQHNTIGGPNILQIWPVAERTVRCSKSTFHLKGAPDILT